MHYVLAKTFFLVVVELTLAPQFVFIESYAFNYDRSVDLDAEL